MHVRDIKKAINLYYNYFVQYNNIMSCLTNPLNLFAILYEDKRWITDDIKLLNSFLK